MFFHRDLLNTLSTFLQDSTTKVKTLVENLSKDVSENMLTEKTFMVETKDMSEQGIYISRLCKDFSYKNMHLYIIDFTCVIARNSNILIIFNLLLVLSKKVFNR